MWTTEKVITESQAYKLVVEHYGTRRALRSQVPLINHINEGLTVLRAIGASDAAQEAFCLHPLLQEDLELFKNVVHVTNTVSAYVVMLAMEYRSVANEFLSQKVTPEIEDTLALFEDYSYISPLIRLSPLKDVNDMLIADKVQNRKDFVTYHSETHARSRQLDVYFKMWLNRLEIDEERYLELCELIDKEKETK